MADWPDTPAATSETAGRVLIKKPPAGGRKKPNLKDNFVISPEYTKLNNRLALLLVAVMVLAPIPLASHRPVWWLLLGVAINGIAVWHLVRGTRIAPDRTLQMFKHAPVFLAGLAVVIFGLLQGMPIAAIIPDALLRLPETNVSGAALRTISVAPDASIIGALRITIYLCFVALVLEAAAQPNRGERMGWLLFFGITAHAVWGLISLNFLGDTLLFGEKAAYQGMATGTFVNRNSYATFLGFGIVLGIALLLDRRGAPRIRASRDPGWLTPERIEMLGVWAMIAMITLALLATQSRMGVGATAVAGLLTFVVMRIKQGHSTAATLLSGGIGFVLFATIALLRGGQGVLERFIFVEGASETRADFYRQILGMIAERPFTGHGLDAFPAAFELYRAAPITAPRYLDMAHNSYLTLWAEMGLLIGSLPILALIAAAVLITRRIMRRTTDLAMPVAALGFLCLGALHSLVDFSLEIPANVLVFLAVIAIGAAHRPVGR